MKKGLIFPILLLSLSPLIPAQDTVHVMRKGETLYAIARDYGVGYDEILRANGISDAKKLQAGQKIRIPAKTVYSSYKVARGDTYFSIARQYGISVKDLVACNGLSEKSPLREGQSLRIPPSSRDKPESGSRPPVPATAAPAASATSVPAASPGSLPGTATSSLSPSSDPRQTQPRAALSSLKWPIQSKDIAYMQGKLYGVVLGGEKSEPIYCISPGTVVSAGPYRGFGRVVIVQASDEYLYLYGGCEDLSVKEGEKVAPGTQLGSLGLDALSNKAQLFFVVYKDNKPIDPALAPRF